MLPLMSDLFLAKNSATPIKIATCASCPQACITPTSLPKYVVLTFDAKGNPVFSSTGKASISALRAIVGPGLPPFINPTSPV